ncbi:MAG: DUF1330 domain-containing protein [Bauldia sp.]|nr:DUF1330 domain-containing protein [Bauldia sp.]
MPYLYPTREAGRDFIMRGLAGPVVMLNLIRLRAVADYSDHPELAPAEPISGREAYERYIAHTLPFLERSGGRLLFSGDGGGWLIGPAEERWDIALLVEQKDTATFLAFESDPDLMRGLGHRQAAIADSRLLPLAPAGPTGQVPHA